MGQLRDKLIEQIDLKVGLERETIEFTATYNDTDEERRRLIQKIYRFINPAHGCAELVSYDLNEWEPGHFILTAYYRDTDHRWSW